MTIHALLWPNFFQYSTFPIQHEYHEIIFGRVFSQFSEQDSLDFIFISPAGSHVNQTLLGLLFLEECGYIQYILILVMLPQKLLISDVN